MINIRQIAFLLILVLPLGQGACRPGNSDDESVLLAALGLQLIALRSGNCVSVRRLGPSPTQGDFSNFSIFYLATGIAFPPGDCPETTVFTDATTAVNAANARLYSRWFREQELLYAAGCDVSIIDRHARNREGWSEFTPELLAEVTFPSACTSLGTGIDMVYCPAGRRVWDRDRDRELQTSTPDILTSMFSSFDQEKQRLRGLTAYDRRTGRLQTHGFSDAAIEAARVYSASDLRTLGEAPVGLLRWLQPYFEQNLTCVELILSTLNADQERLLRSHYDIGSSTSLGFENAAAQSEVLLEVMVCNYGLNIPSNPQSCTPGSFPLY